MESRRENLRLRSLLSPIMNPMHAIIVDLEATCCDAGSIPPHAMEIIEIGAVAVRAGTAHRSRSFKASSGPFGIPG